MGAEPFRSWATLPQPFPLDIDPEPSPIVGLITETLGLCCEAISEFRWNTNFVDVVTSYSR